MPEDVYVARSSSFPSLFARAERLLFPTVPKHGQFKIRASQLHRADQHVLHTATDHAPRLVHIHALGPMIPRAIVLASSLCEKYEGVVEMSDVHTSTEALLDDLEVMDEKSGALLSTKTEQRLNSAIHVTLQVVHESAK